MLQLIVNILLLVIGLRAYNSRNNKYVVVIILSVFFTGMFGIYKYFDSTLYVKDTDFALFFMLLMIFISRKEIKWKSTRYGKILLAFACIHVLYLLYTIICGYESFSFAFKDCRNIFLYLLYFPLQRLDARDLEKAIRCMFVITVILGIRFLLQYAGINIMVSNDDLEIDNGVVRFRNVPDWSIFYLVLIALNRTVIKYKYIFLLFFLALLVLPMARMRIMVFCIVMLVYLFFIAKRYTHILKVSFVAGIIALMLSPYLLARMEGGDRGVSMWDDISLAVNTRNFSSYDSESSGTLGFRLAMLLERFEYLTKNPKYLLTGVGFRHEESPNCDKEFNFFLGTTSENTRSGIAQIHSVDIQWVGVLCQMGLIGVLVWLLFLIFINQILFLFKSDALCEGGLVLCLIFTLGSITEAIWSYNYMHILLVSILLVYVKQIKQNRLFNKSFKL